MMKTLLALFLIVILVGGCNSTPEDMKFAGQNHTATMTMNASIVPSTTPTQIPSQTPSPTISATETQPFTPFPTSTIPPDCGTTKLGKPGTQTNEENQSVLLEGTAILCNHGDLFEDFPDIVFPLPEAMIDLDSDSSNIESADIGFGVYGTMNFYGINEINDAQASIWSLNGLTGEHSPQPSFEECKELANRYNNDNEPEYVCVITNEGHIARVKVEKYNPVQQISSLEISFITWEEQIVKP
jgi:hypothetical protein